MVSSYVSTTAEVEELVGKWSPKTSEKLDLFTGQLKDMMDEVAVDAAGAKDYIDESSAELLTTVFSLLLRHGAG